MASAVDVRVGNELGASNIMSAKCATLVSLTMHSDSLISLSYVLFITFFICIFCDIAGISLVLVSLILIFRNDIGRIFTTEE